ncbi:MAG: hypothetical protein BWY59_01349 [Verrucomicrobia bacterium ADurb.Bin345]|nr:MAG: hypothetical protein BWY59_01349 [Verrucomicrobia bacterium ADurb.Bin345]
MPPILKRRSKLLRLGLQLGIGHKLEALLVELDRFVILLGVKQGLRFIAERGGFRLILLPVLENPFERPYPFLNRSVRPGFKAEPVLRERLIRLAALLQRFGFVPQRRRPRPAILFARHFLAQRGHTIFEFLVRPHRDTAGIGFQGLLELAPVLEIPPLVLERLGVQLLLLPRGGLLFHARDSCLEVGVGRQPDTCAEAVQRGLDVARLVEAFSLSLQIPGAQSQGLLLGYLAFDLLDMLAHLLGRPDRQALTVSGKRFAGLVEAKKFVALIAQFLGSRLENGIFEFLRGDDYFHCRPRRAEFDPVGIAHGRGNRVPAGAAANNHRRWRVRIANGAGRTAAAPFINQRDALRRRGGKLRLECDGLVHCVATLKRDEAGSSAPHLGHVVRFLRPANRHAILARRDFCRGLGNDLFEAGQHGRNAEFRGFVGLQTEADLAEIRGPRENDGVRGHGTPPVFQVGLLGFRYHDGADLLADVRLKRLQRDGHFGGRHREAQGLGTADRLVLPAVRPIEHIHPDFG